MISRISQYLILFCSIQKALSASIDVSNFYCDEGYPMDVLAYKFSCDGGECSFGDYAVFQGQFQYENLTSNIAYMSANVSVAKYIQPMFEFQEIDLCGNFSSDWGGQCPDEDGIYDVSISFQMPSSNGQVMDWFLTGFKAKSTISVYSDEYMSDVLANCYATLKTDTQGYVASQYLNDTVQTPTAFHFLISLWVFLALAACCCCYRRRRRGVDEKSVPLIQMAEQEDTLERIRRYDDIENTRSHDANSVYDGPLIGASESDSKEEKPEQQLPAQDKNFT